MQSFYRVPIAADMLGLHVSALYRLIRQGKVTTKHKHPLTITTGSMMRYLQKQHPGLKQICQI